MFALSLFLIQPTQPHMCCFASIFRLRVMSRVRSQNSHKQREGCRLRRLLPTESPCRAALSLRQTPAFTPVSSLVQNRLSLG